MYFRFAIGTGRSPVVNSQQLEDNRLRLDSYPFFNQDDRIILAELQLYLQVSRMIEAKSISTLQEALDCVAIVEDWRKSCEDISGEITFSSNNSWEDTLSG